MLFQFAFESSNTLVFFATLCTVLASFYLFLTFLRAKQLNLPNGPLGLPVVGYLPFLGKKPHIKLAKLASKYGNIFSLRLGSNLIVVLNNAKVVREAFSKPEILGRPPITIFSVIEKFESPFFSNGKAWQEQRRFALQKMRDLGFGKSRMEGHIQDEIEHLLEDIKQSNGIPVNIKEKLTPSMSNNICSLVFGSRYKYDDPQRLFLDNALERISRSVQQFTPFVFFPWLLKMPFASVIFKYKRVTENFEKVRKFMREHITNHKETLDPNNCRDYIDGYLIEMKHRLQKDPDTTFSENMLTGSAMNFFGAGTESVRTAVDWCLYIVAAYPDVQRKVQTEISQVIGDRMPSWMDQKEMPYTQAVLMEIHRWQTIVPVNPLRYCTADTELQGYHIPKGATILANIWSVHHDPEQWKDPFEFRPERFLQSDGKTIIRSDSFMPFSVGKRSCPGETLALIEVFLYFTSILQKFSVEIPEGTPVSFEGELGITYRLKPHMLCFKNRL